MEERPFKEKSIKPNNENMKDVLKHTYSFYQDLLNKTKSFKNEWNYSKNSGWILKVYDAKKALFYLIPLKDSFKLSLTLRENEKEVLLQDNKIAYSHEQLKTAKKYLEGYVIQFLVSDKESAMSSLQFITKVIELRK